MKEKEKKETEKQVAEVEKTFGGVGPTTDKKIENKKDNKSAKKPKEKEEAEDFTEHEKQDKTSEEEIDYYFSAAEIEAKKNEYFNTLDERNKIAVEKRELANKYKGMLKVKDTELFELEKKIKEKKEKRKIQCIVLFNWRLGKKKCVHPQTGEIVWERNMTDDDKQGRFSL